ncbi:unnamed protein product, partial [Ranitomeya imitator]
MRGHGVRGHVVRRHEWLAAGVSGRSGLPAPGHVGLRLVTRYRSCACPSPRGAGEECPDVQQYYGDTGVQMEHRQCPQPSFCPECGGGLVNFTCGKPCPRSCDHLHGDVVCLDSEECQPSCGCPEGRLLQDGGFFEVWFCLAWSRPLGICTAWRSGDWPVPELHELWGGEQIRVRECQHQECEGKAMQSRMCNTQVCLGKVRYRLSCGPSVPRVREGRDSCPYSCAHLTQQVECFLDDCEEGCHCPQGTYYHNGSCVTVRHCAAETYRYKIEPTMETTTASTGPESPLCDSEECRDRNCSWNPWSEWGECSRSCGVGQQRRFRTYNPPGDRGLWCEDILTGHMERHFCNLQACKVQSADLVWLFERRLTGIQEVAFLLVESDMLSMS